MTMRPSLTTPDRERSQRLFRCLFHPRSIAVVGASSDPSKPGGRVFKCIRSHGFGGQLWPVNPKATNILGLPTHPSIAELPDPPDLAIIAIPAPMVKRALLDLVERGAGATIVLTSGFGEKDDAGKMAEQELCRIADDAGMALVGPNCSGFITTTYKGKFAGIIPPQGDGMVDFISGSGATVDYVMESAIGRGLTFGTVINLGNSVQMGVEDLLALYDGNYGTGCASILLLYMEAVKKPQLLLHHASSLARKGCRLIAIKSGTTDAGSRAAASHTGAMASSDSAVQALFDKAGIIRVHSRQEMIDVACLLQATKGRRPGRRVAVVTDAGGPGVMLADQLARCGLELPSLSENTRLALAKILPPESSLANPIDALPSRTAEKIGEVLRLLGREEREGLDAIAVVTGDSGLSDNGALYSAIGEAMDQSPIPVLPVLSSLHSCREQIDAFTARGKVFFSDEVALGKALGLAVRQPSRPYQSHPPSLSSPCNEKITALIPYERTGALPPSLVRQVLLAAGFPLPQEIEVERQDDLPAACTRLGFPLAMKVVGPLHKTDVGGVRLGIDNIPAAQYAWKELLAIPEARGVVLQEMVKGTELILGASREGDFGHLLMFGLGGIHAEVLKDVTFGLAPVNQDEASRMINTIRGLAILDGVRGGMGVDKEVLIDVLVRLGQLVHDFPRIREIDINPLKGQGSCLYAVDARILVD